MNKKISSEFAIAAILIIAGTFAYIFWKSAAGISTDNSARVSFGSEIAAVANRNEQWKLFRNDNEGYEFNLPKNWKLMDEQGKFATENNGEEINVSIEENKEGYSVADLLEQSIKDDKSANIQPLADISGIKIEKKEADIVNQTAKIIQGKNVITLIYLSQSDVQSADLFDRVLPTLKTID